MTGFRVQLHRIPCSTSRIRCSTSAGSGVQLPPDYAEGTRQGKIVLVQLRETTDPETGQRYTVKRYKSEKAQTGDSWRHEKVTLKPVNPDFEPIVLTAADEGELQVVAKLVEVLEPNAFSPETDSR